VAALYYRGTDGSIPLCSATQPAVGGCSRAAKSIARTHKIGSFGGGLIDPDLF